LLDVLTVVSTNSAPGAEVLVKNELVDDQQVRFVLGKGVIEFRSDFSELGELSPRNVREIVMLNVVSDVKVGDIHNTIVTVGVLALNEFVVFSNDVSSNGVQSETEEGTQNQIYQGLRSEIVSNEDVPREDDNAVDQFHNIHGLGANDVGSKAIEEGHGQDEHELSEGGIEEFDFSLSRKIGIPVGSAQEDVVISVESTEGDGRGDTLTEVGEDSSELVSFSRPESGVMG